MCSSDLAAALGHDVGHTPFGHIGEQVLDLLHPGGFRHNEQSLRTVDVLEKDGVGLNLTHETRQAILKHSKPRGDFLNADELDSLTLEAQIVRVSDAIAYLAHDIGDAIRAGFAPLAGKGWTLRGAGAYFAYLEHPFDAPSDVIAKRLVAEAGILMLPGTMFTPEGDAFGQRTMRVAFANLDAAGIARMIDRLTGFTG